MQPSPLPIGLQLSQAARAVSRAFDDALAEAGGSLPVWLVLLNLQTRQVGNQRELAEAVGVREATLTSQLNAMESQGLVTRSRGSTNRRIHVVELTDAGRAAFLCMRDAAVAFDHQLRRGFSEYQLDALRAALDQLAANSASPPPKGDHTP
ncbi:MAG: MarR family winged helix-turn-helix transcriptional regulator [Acidimicrobiales bacterium]